MQKKSEARLIFSIAYLTAFIAALLSLKYWLTNPSSFLFNIFYADLIGALVIYFNCIFFNSFSIYDPYWTVQASVLSIYYKLQLASENTNEIRAILLLVLVNFWSFRLTANLFLNSIEHVSHEDWRYSDFRQKWSPKIVYFIVGFLSFILLPTVVVYFGCIPMFFVFSSTLPLNNLDLLAFLVTVIGILFESVGDYQLHKELAKIDQSKQKKLVCMDKGLWSLCRHPNYFGEITFWFGVYLFGLAAGASIYDSFYLGVFFLGPFAIFAIINFGSMPLMEERQMKRRTEFYTEYKKRVPCTLLPLSFLFKQSNDNLKSK